MVLADDLANFDPLPGTEQVAAYDPLTRPSAPRADALGREIRALARGPNLAAARCRLAARPRVEPVRDGARPAALDELAALRRRGIAYFVYVAPAPARPSRALSDREQARAWSA